MVYPISKPHFHILELGSDRLVLRGCGRVGTGPPVLGAPGDASIVTVCEDIDHAEPFVEPCAYRRHCAGSSENCGDVRRRLGVRLGVSYCYQIKDGERILVGGRASGCVWFGVLPDLVPSDWLAANLVVFEPSRQVPNATNLASQAKVVGMPIVYDSQNTSLRVRSVVTTEFVALF